MIVLCYVARIQTLLSLVLKGSLIITVDLSLKAILVDPNLVLTFFDNNFFDCYYGAHP